MQTFYSKNNESVQKKTDSTVSTVLDNSSQGESLQRKADLANNAAQRAEAPHPNNTGMPDNLKAGIESLSGFSMDDVRVHYNSSKPATVQALAYTQGTDIHVAPGQEKHLPHEAWHVAQQMAGRVSPTTNINGMPVNDNAGLEHEADVMGAKAVQCKMVGEKSLDSKENDDNVIQCFNCPAYFETENKEGCPNSKYYVDTDTYVRIAPINTRRNPTQEYHEGKRNFVYVKSDGARKFLKDRPMLMKKIEKSDYNIDVARLDFEVEKENVENDGAKLGFFKSRRLKKSLEKSNKIVYSQISRKPEVELSPFDWYGSSHHPGHKITNVSLDRPTLPSREILDKYRARNKYAIDFAFKHFSEDAALKKDWLEYSATCKQPNKEDFISRVTSTNPLAKDSDIRQAIDHVRHKMDKYFKQRWYAAVKASKSEGRPPRDIFDEKMSHYRRASYYFKGLPKFGSGLGPGVIDEDQDLSSGMK